MTTIIHKSPDAFTDATLQKLYRDPGLNKGSMYLFDFLDSYSNPNADGIVPVGAVFKNLVDGGADATLGAPVGSGGATAVIAIAAGKAGITSSGWNAIGSPSLINIGSGPQPAIGTDEVLLTIWTKITGTVAAAVNLLGDTVNTNGAAGTVQWAYGFYVTGSSQTVQAGNRVVGGTIVGPTLSALSTVQQIALRIKGTATDVYRNGAYVGSAVGGLANWGQTDKAPFIGLGQPGTIYRASMERLTTSGRTAIAAVQNEYALNSGRFI